MSEYERIIDALDELRRFVDTDIFPSVMPDYWNVYSKACDSIDIIRDWVEDLSKAQEPRLLDLSELTTVDDILWLEVKDCYLVCAQLEFDFTISYYLFSVMGEEEMVKELQRDYGKTWRCWSSCPTNEQREATPWN